MRRILQRRVLPRSILRSVAIGALAAGLAVGGPFVVAASGPGPEPPIDYRFGVVETLADPAAAAALHVGWSRVPLFWNNLEPTPGTINPFYTGYDQTYRTLVSQGEALVGVVEGAPPWAESHPVPNLMTAPKGLTLPWNAPGNLWGRFMYWLAYHYRGLINVWIIGNEISIHQGRYETWVGTVPQFARLMMVAWQAVHAANPAGAVFAPGAPYWYDHGQTTADLLAALSRLPGARAHHLYVDGLNLHLYNTLLFNAQIYGYYRRLLDHYGLQQVPIWLTEANVAPKTSDLPTGAPPLVQASFLVEDLAASFAWTPRVEVYKMRDDRPPGRYQYGLVTDGGAPRLAFQALQVFIRMLTGATWLKNQLWSPHPGAEHPRGPAVVTWGAPGRLIQVVWDQGFEPTTVTLPAYAKTATVVSLTGQYTTVPAWRGRFRLALAPATYHVAGTPDATIGGPPLFVVQAVPLGAAGTPTTWNVGTPADLPVVPTGRWTRATRLVWPTSDPATLVNPSGDQVIVRTHTGTVWITQAGTAPTALNAPVAAAFAPNGLFYVGNSGNNDVVAWTPTGQPLFAFGGYGTGPGQLLGVGGLAVGEDGRLYVTNPGGQSLQMYTASGRFVAAVGGYGTGPGQFDGPSGVAVGPHGTVYVADTLNSRVEAFTPAGQFVAQVAAPDPASLTVTASGTLAVTPASGGAPVTVTFPRSVGTLPAPPSVTALAVNPSGGYAVATAAGTVSTYSATGTQLATWAIPPAYGNRAVPMLTALAWHGTTLYALDGRYNLLYAINTALPPVPIRVTAHGLVDGGTVTLVPVPAGTLLGPSALAVAPDGTLVVADTDHQRLVVLSPAGTPLRVVSLHDGPRGVAVTGSTVWASGYYGDTLRTVRLGTGTVVPGVFTPGAGPAQLAHPTTVVAWPNGYTAVWDTDNRRAVVVNPGGQPVAWVPAPAGATALAAGPSGEIWWATPNGLVRMTPGTLASTNWTPWLALPGDVPATGAGLGTP